MNRYDRIKPMNLVRTRIAPSPTGENLHIGNAYTALINYVVAKKNNGQFIIRIEDTDRTRLVEGSEGRILESLRWLGLDYDEGPDKGGPFTPYRQSERLSLYQGYAKELIQKGFAYYCFCTTERLLEMRKKQEENKLPSMYDGTCRDLPLVDTQKRADNGEKYVIRLRVDKKGKTEFTDTIRGRISFDNRVIDDQVLLKSDGFPTYHLGVVVDDHVMEISHIIRGEEWISSTPKHILLYQSFGWKLPIFAHVPLLRNPDKSKLSKRKNPVWVSWYKEQGILPEALINYLALMGWSMPDGRDMFTIDEMIINFKLEDVRTTAPIFDIEKLKWLNKKYIQKLQETNLDAFIKQVKNLSVFGSEKSFESLVRKVAPIVAPRIRTLKEYDAMAGYFHTEPKKYEIDLTPHKKILVQSKEVLEGIESLQWNAEKIADVLQRCAKDIGISNTEFFMVLRVAVTGNTVSPPLNDSLDILGKEKSLMRLMKASK